MRPPALWRLPRIDDQRAVDLAAALGIGRLAAKVLVRRGYGEPEAASRFLRPSLADLHDPLLLAGMRQAISRLRRAIENGEPILLYGDYDADGTTALVLLKAALERAGAQVRFYVPHRLREGYGMRPEVIEEAATAGVKLVISVDTGIRAHEAVRRARDLGLDVIVTDHHLPEAQLPPATVILNPNQPGCSYPDKNLCGVGVAFKVAQALFASLGWPEERRRRLEESFLKLAAIGTVADVAPLTGENRILVKLGLEGLRKVRNPGLRALLDTAGFAEGDRPSAGQVAFRIAPRINAAGRMADAADAIRLFLTDDPETARELAARLHGWNQERQQAESEILHQILEACARTPVTPRQKALVFCGEGWHRGVVGIVAARLVEEYYRPSFVLSVDSESGLAEGSGRSIPRFHLLEALETMPDLFVRFGGHRQAAGVTLKAERVEEFRSRLDHYAAARLTDEDLVPELEIDAMLDFREIDERNVTDVLALAPFGCGNPRPLFAALGAEVAAEPSVWNDKHLRVHLRQNGRTLTVTGWRMADRAAEFGRGARLDVVVSFDEDPHGLARGWEGWCATLEAVRPG
ncbi:MAG: single-stranded-DNA-specific exonuclease RecJ [Bryobacterales bacterium]|nr:single-stranded-DNA-specific exonuclease RecJ [Bryobacteraceae bacterium]MDW8355021.1 single-stranded-DNA-specific exonuclease RecJ [Bryobacterales bacterium]